MSEKVRLPQFGLSIAQGLSKLLQEVKRVIADMKNGLPPLMRDLGQRLRSHLLAVDKQVQEIDRKRTATASFV